MCNKDQEQKKRSWKILKIVVIVAVIIMIAITLFFVIKKPSLKQAFADVTHPAEVTFTEAQLKDAFEISELSTATYTYNSIASAYDKDHETVRYHVSYEGTVKVGVDFNDIDVKIDESNKKITLTLPDAEVLELNVNAGTMAYIFTDEKYDTETVAQEAYRLSREDLKNKAEKEQQLYETAKENAIAAVEALVTPWIEQMNADYTVSVN
ncbi:MAG: DUF4230 domain-containing protein [Ruminococcus callidus]|nr:DUF4230 domain-containing protein [Ruminococcus callidus]